MKIRNLLRSAREHTQGAAMVEFALSFPILVFLMVGFFDIGLAVYSKNTVASAAREGARRAIILTATDDQIRAAAKQVAVGLPLTNSDIVINPSPSRSSGDPVTVTVNYVYRPITPMIGRLIFGGGNLPMSSQTQMIVE